MNTFLNHAMRELQTPEHAERIAIMVTESLDTVRGFSVLPRDLQLEICKATSAFYGAGYVKGFKAGYDKGMRA